MYEKIAIIIIMIAILCAIVGSLFGVVADRIYLEKLGCKLTVEKVERSK